MKLACLGFVLLLVSTASSCSSRSSPASDPTEEPGLMAPVATDDPAAALDNAERVARLPCDMRSAPRGWDSGHEEESPWQALVRVRRWVDGLECPAATSGVRALLEQAQERGGGFVFSEAAVATARARLEGTACGDAWSQSESFDPLVAFRHCPITVSVDSGLRDARGSWGGYAVVWVFRRMLTEALAENVASEATVLSVDAEVTAAAQVLLNALDVQFGDAGPCSYTRLVERWESDWSVRETRSASLELERLSVCAATRGGRFAGPDRIYDRSLTLPVAGSGAAPLTGYEFMLAYFWLQGIANEADGARAESDCDASWAGLADRARTAAAGLCDL